MDSTTTTTMSALPPVVDAAQWRRQLDELRVREKAATRELDAIAAQRRRLPMVEMPDYILQSPNGPVTAGRHVPGQDAADHLPPHVVRRETTGSAPAARASRLSSRGSTSSTRTTRGSSSSRRARSARPSPTARRSATGWSGTRRPAARSGRRRCTAGRRVRRERLPARRRHGLPHLAHERSRHRAAHPHLPAHRPAAVRPAGGVAGLAGGLAAASDLFGLGRSQDIARLYGPNRDGA